MPITINSNIASMNAQRRLLESTAVLGKTFQRLSSGLRINSAADDAAGLAIASSLSVDSRVYSQGIRNLNDGLSAFSIAEGAVSNLANVVTRITELSEQAANGTLTLTQRKALNAEAGALVSEYNRIVDTTTFNGQNLIDGTLTDLSIQSGYGQNGSLLLGIGRQLQRNIGDGSFSASIAYTVGSAPRSVTAGDLNGDGSVDLISADLTSNTVSVILGNEMVPFDHAQRLPPEPPPFEVISADLNGDGKIDLVTTDDAASTTSVLIGNGDGSFLARKAYATGAAPFSVLASDVNGDGKLDLITTDGSDSVVSVLMGNGNGTFKARLSYQVGSATDVVALDVNGDGRSDLVALNSTTSSVSVLLGNGDGSFQAQVIYKTGSNPFGLVSTDINGDGRDDLITTDTTSNEVSILLGNGDGTFKINTTLAVGTSPRSVISVDFNDDGFVDLVTANANSNNTSVLLGNGNGTFKAQVTYATGTSTRAVIAVDVNGDNRLDLIGANNGDNTIGILLGNGGSTSHITAVNLTTQNSALAGLDLMRTALNRITSELGSQGASESRLQTAVANLQVIRENFERAASQIMDVDVAAESSQLTRTNILQQAGAAVLAQANQQPSLAIQLLRNI